ncbi:hypothetical protein OQA88_11962 [Cercophora sp. LCS_1]
MATNAKDLIGSLPPRRLTKEELAKTHKVHLKKQDLSPNTPRPVKQPVMSEAYPASTKSIRELEIVSLCRLTGGKGIIVKVISPPFVGAGAVSLVEDEFGNADKLAIYNQPDSAILSGVPEGCVVAVKEPYYKLNGNATDNDYMICVDHPSDVTLLRFTDPIIPESLRLGPLLKTAEDWKKAGDTAFLEKDFPTAVFCYSEALVEATDDASRAPVHTKRAGTNLLLGRYDAAKADSLASRVGGPSDWKAYYNAGRAAYGLCDYKECKEYLEKALELNPSASAVRKELDRCLARVHEEETGEYDFKAMYESLNHQTNVHLDRGSFTKRTVVHESEHHGRGIFAAEDIKAGELIFVEKATLMPNQYEPVRASAALYAMMVRQLCENPSLCGPIFKMHPGEIEKTGLEGTIVDGVPVVDIFVVEGIRTKNCFSCPLSTLDDTKIANTDSRQAKGVWVHAANMNHSCVPNSMRAFLGDMLISRATRDIKAGEEIFQQYVPVKALLDVRNKQYKESWIFECNCTLCAGERNSTDAMLAKRKEALVAVEKVCNKKLPKGEIIPDATIRTVDKLARQLEDLHEPEVYDRLQLPRLTLIYPCNWLVGAHRGRKNWAKVAKYGCRVLRNFGFLVPLEEGAEWDPRAMWTASGDASLMTIHVIASLRRLAQAYEMLGKAEMGRRCSEAAQFGYLMVTGFDNDMTGLDRD